MTIMPMSYFERWEVIMDDGPLQGVAGILILGIIAGFPINPMISWIFGVALLMMPQMVF